MYMVISRVKKGIEYAGSWHKTRKAAGKFAKELKEKHGVPVIITKKPKSNYRF